MEKNNIVILGCGIAGMLTAIALERAGIPVIVIEKKDKNSLLNPDDPRTTALNSSSIKFMEKLGLLPSFKEYLQPIKDIYVCQNMKDNIFHMDGKGSALGHMIKNVDLRRILYQTVLRSDLIKLCSSSSYRNLEVNDLGVSIDCGDERISAKLCIAADGRFSEAKKKFFKNRMYKDYGQKAMVFNILHSTPHEGGAIEHFLPRGSFATLPLKGGTESGVVWVEQNKIADFYITQSNPVLENQISKFIGASLGAIKINSAISSFPLEAFISEKYFYKRLALVADSAHSMHPLAGQGLNMGIKDVIKLTELISKNMSLGLALDDVMLASYELARKADNIAMVKITDTINSIFTCKSKIIEGITFLGLGAINKMPILSNLLINYAKGNRN